jgi:hypothetical protein
MQVLVLEVAGHERGPFCGRQGWNTTATPAGATGFTPSAGGANTAATAGTGIFVYVGATVSPPAAQPAGSYAGTVTMSVVYF